MRRLSLVLIALLFVVSGLAAADWQAVVRDSAMKVPRLEILQDGADSPGTCSGVVFSIDTDGTGELLTAGHCVLGDRPTITVNRRHATLAMVNRLLDLAIVTFDAKNEMVMPFAPSTPPMGADVAILGYPFGASEMAAQFGHVSQPLSADTHALMVDAQLIFGDSGGAAIDSAGHLVGINSRIYYGGQQGQMAHLSALVAIEDVADFVAAYRKAKGKK